MLIVNLCLLDMEHIERGYHTNLPTRPTAHKSTIHGSVHVSLKNKILFPLWSCRRRETNFNMLFFVFRLVYNYCTTVTQKSAKKPATILAGATIAKSGGAELIGQELYKRLKTFLEQYLIDLLKVSCCCLANALFIIIIIVWCQNQFGRIEIDCVDI